MEVDFCQFLLLCHNLIGRVLYVIWLPVWLCCWLSDCQGPWSDMALRRPQLCTSVHKIAKSGVLAGQPHRSLTSLTPLWTARVCAFIGSGGQTDEVLWSMKPGCLVWRRHTTCPDVHPHPGSSRPVKRQTQATSYMGRE